MNDQDEYPFSVEMPKDQEFRDWLREQLPGKGRWAELGIGGEGDYVVFADKGDAALFKVRWG